MIDIYTWKITIQLTGFGLAYACPNNSKKIGDVTACAIAQKVPIIQNDKHEDDFMKRTELGVFCRAVTYPVQFIW